MGRRNPVQLESLQVQKLQGLVSNGRLPLKERSCRPGSATAGSALTIFLKCSCSKCISKIQRCFGAHKDFSCFWELHQDCCLWGAGSASQLGTMTKATDVNPPQGHPRNLGSQFHFSMVAWGDPWCTSGGRTVCASLSPQGVAVVQSKQFQGCTICSASPYSNVSVLFFTPYGVIGIFSIAQTGHWFSPPNCKWESGGILVRGDPNLVPPRGSCLISFPPVQEDLRAEVQGGGRGRAVLGTHQRFRQPKANRKGTWDGSAVQSYKRIPFTNPFYTMPGALSSN